MPKFDDVRIKVFAPKWKFLRFLLIGGWNAFFSLSLFYFLLYFLKTNFYELALFITFLVSTFQSYLTQTLFVWRNGIFLIKEFSHFLLVCTTQYLINAGAMLILVSGLHFSPKLMQIPVSLGIAVGFYLYFKNKVFVNERRKKP